MRSITRLYMELHDVIKWIVHDAVWVKLLNCTYSCMNSIKRLYMEEYEINLDCTWGCMRLFTGLYMELY
jgi:hypothetical protein